MIDTHTERYNPTMRIRIPVATMVSMLVYNYYSIGWLLFSLLSVQQQQPAHRLPILPLVYSYSATSRLFRYHDNIQRRITFMRPSFYHYRNNDSILLPRHDTTVVSSVVLLRVTSNRISDTTPTIDTTKVVTTTTTTTTSLTLGHMIPMLLQNPSTSSSSTISFVEAMRIPTFLCGGGGWLDHNQQSESSLSSSEEMKALLWSPPTPAPSRVIQNVSWYENNTTTNNNDSPHHHYSMNRTDQYGPAMTISNILSPLECQDIIKSCEMAMYHHQYTVKKPNTTLSSSSPQQQQVSKSLDDGRNITLSVKYEATSSRTTVNSPGSHNDLYPNQSNSNYSSTTIQKPPVSSGKKNQHGAMQLIVPQSTVDTIAQRIAPFIPVHMVQDRKQELDQHHPKLHNLNITSPETSSSSSQLMFVGLNRRFRIYKYAPNHLDHFKPHIDAGFPPSGIMIQTTTNHSDNFSTPTTTKRTTHDDSFVNSASENPPVLRFDDTQQFMETLQTEYPFHNNYTIVDVVSRLTILFYLNDNFTGGTTNFYEPIVLQNRQHRSNETSTMNNDTDTTNSDPVMIASIQPKTGMVLIFPQCVGADVMDQYSKWHWPTHEGSPVHVGSPMSKYVIRSDLLFAEVIPTEKRK